MVTIDCNDFKRSLAVVIPCYNCTDTLNRALKSVVTQTRIPDEIIVIDDFSDNPEEIEAIVSLYSNVKLLRNQKNIGLAGSRNVGIWSTECDIVTFLDADDECHPIRFEEQLKYISSNTVVTCDTANPNNNDNLKNLGTIQTKKHSIPILNMLFPSLTGAALMAEVSLLKKLGGYDSELRACEDYELWLRLLSSGVNVIRVEAPLYLYYDVKDSLSKNAILIAKSTIVSVKKYLDKNRFQISLIPAFVVWFLILSKVYVNLEIQSVERATINTLHDYIKHSISPFLLKATALLSKVRFYRIAAVFILRFRQGKIAWQSKSRF